MDIIIDKNLQKLRADKGNTQEDLASFLLVSSQAVSKWERGESIPDVALLPRIASYYNVTVDDLLGVGEIRRKEQIEAYREEAMKFARSGEIEKRIEVWRRAVAEFPNNHECLIGLLQSLHSANGVNGADTLDEVIKIGEKILDESTNDRTRYLAIQILVLNFINLERFDEAKKYIDDLPSVYVTSGNFLSRLYTAESDAENGKRTIFGNILDYFDIIRDELYNLCCLNRGNYEHYIKLHEFYIKLADLIFDDGFYGFYNCRINLRHYWLAKLYTNLHNDEEKARYHIEAAAKCAIDYDNLPQEYVYHGTIFDDGYKCSRNNITKNNPAGQKELLLKHFDGAGLDDGSFDRWREKDWFKAVIRSLEKACAKN